MTEIYIFIKANMVCMVLISAVMQIIGTLVLALFSFFGIEITVSKNNFSNGKPITHVTMNERWLGAARLGLIILLLGIFLSGAAGVAASVQA